MGWNEEGGGKERKPRLMQFIERLKLAQTVKEGEKEKEKESEREEIKRKINDAKLSRIQHCE